MASHTLAKLYAVLSTLPLKPRISPSVAWRPINENIALNNKVISLKTNDYCKAIMSMSEIGLIEGTIYDALIAKVAQKANVERILTLKINHFQKVW